MRDDDTWPVPDRQQMDRALLLAERGRGATSPNPMVGAVVTDAAGVVVGAGYHARAGLPHAEVVALDQAGARARGGTLYCTLEPCCHVGRTGPCVERIVAAGAVRVVAAIEDPNPLVRGRGLAYLAERGVAVEVGLRRRAATRLNRAFLTFMQHGRPFVIAKAATSADGVIAARPGAPTALTGPDARRHAQGVRAEVDAIGVGSGTILADDPLLTVRGVYRRRPLVRVVFDRRLRTPPSARILSTLAAGPVIIMTTGEAARTPRARALSEAGARVEAGGATFASALERLAVLPVLSLLVEGGAVLHGAAWDEALIDYVQLYVAPVILGPRGLPVFNGRPVPVAGLVESRAEPLGADVLMEGYVHGID